jgi:toxin ParE1/3/4
MRRSLSDEALADFEAAVDWYLDALAFVAAEDFADEVEQAIRLIESFPNAGINAPHKTRVFTLRKFPYRLVYRAEPEHVRIIAVAHQRRKPSFWRGRT